MLKSNKRECTHCGGTNLTAETKRVKGYSNLVFNETFKCTCGAESVKCTVLKKKDEIPSKFKKFV